MMNQRKAASVPDFTEEELAVYGDFSNALRDGEHPDIEQYLKRAPMAVARLRRLLETEKRLHAELTKLRAEYPGVDLARLLDPDWRSRKK
jgi:hypothetical protein